MDQKLEKAKLYCLDGEKYTVEFMFNPTQVEFTRGIKLSQPGGANTRGGRPKVSFAQPDDCVITLSKILFDTYEGGGNVLDKLEPLVQAVKFLDPNAPGSRDAVAQIQPAPKHSASTTQRAQNKRPPVYLFMWGQQQYLRCFVESFKYQLTMFLPDGTPVRATASLTLKEVDESVEPADPRPPAQPDRKKDNRSDRTPQKR